LDIKIRQRNMALLQFTYWAALCSSSYLSQYARELGMSGVAVGTMAALIAAMGMVAPPIFGIVADKIGSSRKVFLLCWAVFTAGWIAVALTGSIIVMGLSLAVILMVAASAFRLPAGSLLDSWMLQLQDGGTGLDYAKARKYGSLGYGVMGVLSGFFVKPLGIVSVFWLPLIATIPVLWLTKGIGDVDPGPNAVAHAAREQKRNPLGLGKLFKNYYFMTFLACAIFTYMPQYANGTYLPYLFTEVMGDASVIGTFTGIRAIMEMPGMILAAMIAKKVKLRTLALCVFAYYGVEQLIYAVAYDGTVLITMMLTSGMAYGFYLYAIVRYVHSLAPKNLSATAMTVNSAVMAASGIIGNFVGGMMVDTVGFRPFYVLMGVLILAATAVYLVTLIIGKKRGIPLAEEAN